MNRKMDYGESRAYAIKSICDFLGGTGGKWDWDDFISMPLGFPDLEDLQRFCIALSAIHPPTLRGWYCSEEGLRSLRVRLEDLKGNASATKP
jgi:hypothetical protein